MTIANPRSVSAPRISALSRTESASLLLATPARYVSRTAAMARRTSAWPCSLSGRLANACSMRGKAADGTARSGDRGSPEIAVDFLEAVAPLHDRRDDRRIELRTCALLQHRERLGGTPRRSVGPVARHRLEHAGGGDDARRQRDVARR